MPVLDTPITTDDRSIDKVLAQSLPAVLIFHSDDIDKALDDALRKEARKRAGDVLIVRLARSDSRDTYIKYGEPPTPALVLLSKPQGFRNKRQVVADAEAIRPADVRAYIAHLLDDAPLPSEKTAAAQQPAEPVIVSDQTFREEVLKSKVPVLVDFWAAWCGPCRTIAPHVEQLAREYAGRIKVAKLDVDRNQVMSRRYNVSSIPTMIVFEAGQPAARIVGADPTSLRRTVARFAK